MKHLLRHLLSVVSLTAITLNLVFWMIPLLAVYLVHVIASSGQVATVCFNLTEFIYRSAVGFDTWWITRVLGVRIVVEGEQPGRENRNLIAVSNHRSWFDVLVLQPVIVDHGPIVKFLIKRELVRVPILGWICLALDFPRLNRSGKPDKRDSDYQAIANATSELRKRPLALLNFAEGTRFTGEKHTAQNSPYRYLLKPKPGGLRIMLENVENADILDMTVAYPKKDIDFWGCLGGELDYVKIHLDYFKSSEIIDPGEWLAERWRIKDELIAEEFTGGLA